MLIKMMRILVVIALLVLHGLYISPALWGHQSSAAFQLNIALWIVGISGLVVVLLTPGRKVRP